MPKNIETKSWLKKTTQIVGMNPITFDEWWRFRINRLQLMSIIILLFLLFFFISYLLYALTPIGGILPEGATNRNRKKIEKTALIASELEKKVAAQEKYISNLQNVILGNIPIDSVFNENEFDTPAIYEKIDTTTSEAEKELDKSIQEQINKSRVSSSNNFSQLFLFDPVEGTISQSFKNKTHPGVDVVAKINDPIKSIANGVVLYASFNELDGYTVLINHENGIVSVYKHANSIMIKEGDKVTTGQVIGMVGNTGKHSSGPHLHFEMWSSLGALNPTDYLSFGR